MPPDLTLADILFPARDSHLKTIIQDLSEPESGPVADNLITNEDSFTRVAGELARRAPRDGVYLGVGPDQNFTLLAHAPPRLAFILDYRRRNLLLHLVHKALFTLSDDRVAYLARLTARRPGALPANPTAAELVTAFGSPPLDRALLQRTIDEVAAVLRPLDVVAEDEWPALATIQSKLAGPGVNARFLALPMYPSFARLIEATDREGRPAHLLAHEPFYQAVRTLQRGDRIIPVVGDFGRAASLGKLGAWLRQHRLTLSLVYVSDVEFFLLRAGRFSVYVGSLARLPWTEGAMIVRTSTREVEHPERARGDSSTTVVRDVATFLAAAGAGKVRTIDDLFALLESG